MLRSGKRCFITEIRERIRLARDVVSRLNVLKNRCVSRLTELRLLKALAELISELLGVGTHPAPLFFTYILFRQITYLHLHTNCIRTFKDRVKS